MIVGQILYRAQDYGDTVEYLHYVVVKATPKGGWVRQIAPPGDRIFQAGPPATRPDGLRWVAAGGRFASATKEDALARLRMRVLSHIRHAARRYADARMRAYAVGLDPDVRTDAGLFSTSRWGRP